MSHSRFQQPPKPFAHAFPFLTDLGLDEYLNEQYKTHPLYNGNSQYIIGRDELERRLLKRETRLPGNHPTDIFAHELILLQYIDRLPEILVTYTEYYSNYEDTAVEKLYLSLKSLRHKQARFKHQLPLYFSVSSHLEPSDALRVLELDGARPFPPDLVKESWNIDKYDLNLQLFRWRDFRRFQKFVRAEDNGTYSGGFCLTKGSPMLLCDERSWEQLIGEDLLSTSDSRFSSYLQAAKRRLEMYVGSTELCLNFHQNPAEQNELDTWVEYLVFECWMLKIFDSSSACERRMAKIWRRFQDEGKVEPDATLKSEQKRLEEAESKRDKTLERLITARIKWESARDLGLKSGKKLYTAFEDAYWDDQDAKMAFYELSSLKKSLKEYLSETYRTRERMDEIANHKKVVQWIFEQIPIIKQDMREAGSRWIDPDPQVIMEETKRPKRSRLESEDDDAVVAVAKIARKMRKVSLRSENSGREDMKSSRRSSSGRCHTELLVVEDMEVD